MVEIKELLENELNQIVTEQEFNKQLLTKDYYLTIILYLLKNINGKTITKKILKKKKKKRVFF